MWLFQFEILKQKTSTREEREYNTFIHKNFGTIGKHVLQYFWLVYMYMSADGLRVQFFLKYSFFNIYINLSHTVGYPSNIIESCTREFYNDTGGNSTYNG